MKINVLVAGIGQSNYLFQLYGNISERLGFINFNSLNLRQFGDQDINGRAERIFQKNYQFLFNSKNLFSLIGAVSRIITYRYFWKDQSISFTENGLSLTNFFILTKKHIAAYKLARFVDFETDTNIIHLHFPSHRNSLFLIYLKKEYSIIQTFWGSDIFRIKNWKRHEIQKETLYRSELITAATPEMIFAILSRYGFELSSKIRRARFIHDDKYYAVAKKYINNEDWKDKFLKEMSIYDNKITVLFGHNAFKANNHLKFIEVLKDLPLEISTLLHIIFPLTYGDQSGGYIKLVKDEMGSLPISCTFIEDFMDWEFLAKLKLASDVYIHAPTTDGLSAFLTEFFFTNNMAIVGNWLPYKTFADYGIQYLKFEDFKSLKNILLQLPMHLEEFKAAGIRNNSIIEENFSVNNIAEEWVRIFEEFEAESYG